MSRKRLLFCSGFQVEKNAQAEELVRIAKSEALVAGDFDGAVREITESAARALGVERVGVWFYDESHSSIRCADLFEKSKNKHSCGMALSRNDFPVYFAALQKERTIAAADAHTDSRTREFSEIYLSPLGIGAMLDAPIRVGGEMVGVVCHEHVGPAREWSGEETAFSGSMADFIALAQEVQTRKLAEEALRREVGARVRQERLAALGEMSAVVAHEVRNPIGAIYNSVSCLRRLVGTSDEIAKLLVVLEEESQRLLALTDNLLDVARPVGARRQYCDIATIIERAVAAVRRQPRYADRKLLIDIEGLSGDTTIYADVNLLHRVVVNLVTNAIEATDEGGRVGLRVHPADNDTVEVSFTNPGEGLSNEDAARIFEPFFTTKAVGSGLGLAIVRSLMATLHGRVEFRCEESAIIFSIIVPCNAMASATMPPVVD